MKIKVSRSTSVTGLYGCILSTLEQHREAEVSAVGASALNQMFKAVALVSDKLGNTVRCTPKLYRENEVSYCAMFLEVT